MSVIINGKLDGDIQVTGTGTQNGAAILRLSSTIRANYTEEQYSDIVLYTEEKRLEGAVDMDGVLWFNVGETQTKTYEYNIYKIIQDPETQLQFELTGKWYISGKDNEITIVKDTLRVETSVFEEELPPEVDPEEPEVVVFEYLPATKSFSIDERQKQSLLGAATWKTILTGVISINVLPRTDGENGTAFLNLDGTELTSTTIYPTNTTFDDGSFNEGSIEFNITTNSGLVTLRVDFLGAGNTVEIKTIQLLSFPANWNTPRIRY